MGDKYIKKGEDGKEYLYEDMGLGGLLFGDRKIGEVKDNDFISKAFGGSGATVKSNDIFSTESYSVNRDDNPVGGLWGAPDYLNTQVTDDSTGETSDYVYESRFDGSRYSEQREDTTSSHNSLSGQSCLDSNLTDADPSRSGCQNSVNQGYSSPVSAMDCKSDQFKTQHRSLAVKRDHRTVRRDHRKDHRR